MPETTGAEPSIENGGGECKVPRRYKLGRRQAATDENRARIIAAARELVMGEEALKGFTIDAVAQRAGVARMTVYHQFKSKLGVLQALFDEISARGGMERMGQVFTAPTPEVAIGIYIEIFCTFWGSDRVLMRRLGALSTLDPEFGKGIRERSGWRTNGCHNLAQRLNEQNQIPAHLTTEKVAEILFTLTSFQTFDSLWGESQTEEEAQAMVKYLVWSALGLKNSGQNGRFEGQFQREGNLESPLID